MKKSSWKHLDCWLGKGSKVLPADWSVRNITSSCFNEHEARFRGSSSQSEDVGGREQTGGRKTDVLWLHFERGEWERRNIWVLHQFRESEALKQTSVSPVCGEQTQAAQTVSQSSVWMRHNEADEDLKINWTKGFWWKLQLSSQKNLNLSGALWWNLLIDLSSSKVSGLFSECFRERSVVVCPLVLH